MFWKYNNSSPSQINALLEKEDVCLKEVLEQEDIIQECKHPNKKLVEFLVNTDVLSELISLIISEPPSDVEESQRFRLPHIAAEILSCEVSHINEKVSSDMNLLNKLYSFIEQEPPLNPLLSSFFSKAFNVLITRKSEQNWYNYQITCIQVFEFLKGKDFVKHVLKHIGTSAIPDLVFGLITCVEATEIKQNLLNWLNEERLIESIIGLLDSELYDRDTHDNAARLLVELLRVSRDAQYVPASERCNDPLLAVLESPSTITLILDTMFKHIDAEAAAAKESDKAFYPSVSNESVIVNGVTVLLAVLETRKAVNSDETGSNPIGGAGEEVAGGASSEESLKQQLLLDAVVAAILPRLSDMTRLLTYPPLRSPLKTTVGTLEPPLGATRLSVAKLTCALLTTNNTEVIKKLKELKSVDVLIDLFFRYSLNNFLHAQVEQCINFVFTWTPASYADSSSISNESLKGDDVSQKDSKEAAEENSVDEEKAETEAVEDKAEECTDKGEPQVEDLETRNDKGEEQSSNDDQEMQEGLFEDQGDDDDDDHVPNADLEWETTLKIESEKAAKIMEANCASHENPLLEHLYLECRLVERVLDAWQENDTEELKGKHLRKGYMAHLTRIANIMQHHMENKTMCHDLVGKLMKQLPELTSSNWTKFVQGQLAETNERNTIVSANYYSANSRRATCGEDDDSDFRKIQFHSDSMQQMFSDYQMQQMSDNLVDSFGFNDGDETGGSMKRFLNFNFGLDEVSVSDEKGAEVSGDNGKDLFEMVCKERFNTIDNEDDQDKKEESDDEEEEEDPWASRTKEIKFDIAGPSSGGDKTAVSKDAKAGKGDEVSSDEDENGKDQDGSGEMDVDDEWSALDRRATEVAPIDMDIGNPWDSAAATSSPTHEFEKAFSSASGENNAQPSGPSSSGKDAVNSDEGWANFNAFQSQETEQSIHADDDKAKTSVVGAATEAKPVAEQSVESIISPAIQS